MIRSTWYEHRICLTVQWIIAIKIHEQGWDGSLGYFLRESFLFTLEGRI